MKNTNDKTSDGQSSQKSEEDAGSKLGRGKRVVFHMEVLVQMAGGMAAIALAIAAILGVFSHHKYAALWLTWLGVCCILASLTAWFQDKEEKKEAASASIAEGRPNLQFVGLSLVFTDEEKENIKLKYRIINTGKLGAVLYISKVTCAFTPEPDQKEFKYGNGPSSEVTIPNIPNVSIPGVLVFADHLAKDSIPLLNSGKMLMYVTAKCEYHGDDGIMYPLPFLMMYTHHFPSKLRPAPKSIVFN